MSVFIISELTQNQDSFNNFMIAYHTNLGIKFGCVGLILIFQYHIFTGIRHILMDFHILNESLSSSYKSAVTTIVLFAVNTLLTLWVML
jgi:succinate dehydrogenase cytochrome b556 subunit